MKLIVKIVYTIIVLVFLIVSLIYIAKGIMNDTKCEGTRKDCESCPFPRCKDWRKRK